MKAEAQQRTPGSRGLAWVRERGGWCAHLTVLKSAYTSKFFPALGHSRNTSSGRQKAAGDVPHSLAQSPPDSRSQACP